MTTLMDFKKLYKIFNTQEIADTAREINTLLLDDIVKIQSVAIALQYLQGQIKSIKKWYPDTPQSKLEELQVTTYNNVYKLIASISVQELHLRKITLYPDEYSYMENSFLELLKYYEYQEEYLKCQVIKEILDFLETCKVVDTL
jgi:hypothetical protein